MLKAFLWISVILIILIVGVGFAAARKSVTVAPPVINNGALPQCGDKPNCVSSEMPQKHPSYVKPIEMTDTEVSDSSQDTAMTMARKHVESLGGSVKETDANSIQAEFKSSFFGFIDDVLLQLDEEAGIYRVRSSSRVGHSDLGVNRKRIEALRQLLSRKSA